MSTSVSRDKAKIYAADNMEESGLMVIMKIRSKNGVCITKAAVHRDDLEVLYRKGVKFKVVSRRRIADNTIQFELEEI